MYRKPLLSLKKNGQNMSWEAIVFGILPIVFYVFVDMRYGMKAGIYTALVSVIVVVSWFFWRTNQIDKFVLFDGVLMCGLGVLSLRLNNPRYFKLQPFIIGMILGLYTLYFQIFSEPLLLHYIPTMRLLLEPEAAAMLSSDTVRHAFSIMSLHLAFLFIAHALACLVASLRWSNFTWMCVRLSIYPILMSLCLVDLLLFYKPA